MIKSSTEGELWLPYRDASLAALRGQIRQSRELCGRTRETARRMNLRESAIWAVVDLAGVGASFGYPEQAEKDSAEALSMSPGWSPKLGIAWTLALVGNEQKASALMQDVAARRAEDTWVQSVSVPGILAILELKRGNPGKALELLKAARPYDRASFDTLLIRGTACLKVGQGVEAAQEFNKILDLRNWDPTNYRLALAQLGLARSYVLQGENEKARTAYQDLLALWKDADPDLPILRKAKAEYAELH